VPCRQWARKRAVEFPILPRRVDAAAYEKAFVQARAVLADGELLCLFPEGAITRDGELGEFKAGVMKLLQTTPVPVVPMELQNLWGSYFSRAGGAAMSKPFRRGLFSSVGLVAGCALSANEATPTALRDRVAGLLSS
jgi:1-acyl-sn-glycerol-3-phosphate acyltransferase